MTVCRASERTEEGATSSSNNQRGKRIEGRENIE